MADLLETRCVSETFLGSPHVLRVACIGDSMMYGQGVPARETLPAHLSRFLNAALLDRIVWVDGFGESAGNLWHAWTQFKSRTQRMRFDAVVFSLCQNDISLFESNTVEYRNPDYVALWSADSDLTAAASDVLADVRQHCANAGIAPLVFFYSLIEEDRPIVERIAAMCGERRLPFFDLLSFLRMRTGITAATYAATEFDGHPSGLAHELAARGLVDAFRALPGIDAGRIGGDPEDAFAAALDDLLAQGVEADVALDWAAGGLAAKQNAARRALRSDGPAAADFETLAGKIDGLAQTWRLLRRLETRVELADQGDAPKRRTEWRDWIRPRRSSAPLPQSPLLPALGQLYVTIRNLDEHVFVLRETADRARLAAFGARFATGHYAQAGRLDFFRGDAAAEIGRVREALAALPLVGLLRRLAEEDPGERWRSPAAHAGLTPAALDPELARLGQFAARFRAQLDALSNAWTAAAAGWDDDRDVVRLWAVAMLGLRYALGQFRQCDAAFGDGPRLEAPIPSRWTSVDVVVESGPDAAVCGPVYLLRVDTRYRVPRRMPLREILWGGTGKDRYAHHFEIPALLLGDIRVGVADDEPVRERFLRGTTRIAEIRISSGSPDGPTPPRVAIEWRNPGSNLAYVDFRGVALP